MSQAEIRAYLLAGSPGVGKTTIVRETVAGIRGKAGGFYTQEIREGGERKGFRLITLDGKSAALSHINIPSPWRVSKYGVDIEALERVGVTALEEAACNSDLIVVDEIGKMELFSSLFQEAVMTCLNSGKMVLGTIMLASHPFADKIKALPGVRLIQVTRTNHHEVLHELLRRLESVVI